MKIDNKEIRAVASVDSPTQERYEAFGGTYKVVPKERLRAAGWRVTKGMQPVTYRAADTWIDNQTGELLTNSEAKKRGIKLPLVRSTSEKMLDMCECVAACTPTERPFVSFLLGMRNHRGGLVAPLDALLDQWIAIEHPDTSTTNRARKRKQLRAIIERRQLMANETTMARNLMLLNPNMTKQDVIEEGAKRYNLRMRNQSCSRHVESTGQTLSAIRSALPAKN
ncbi:hypothetical protein AWB82_06180 [Caballeronia glebae]|uniref:Uncharacterized protein n=1 Tax=Caballeronia glebae TaxID=1777143 RepID=A0A158D2S1_9BURK|nr:hypothetical protein [Caballeronia glebae]SAK88650.1 hypothetical protein AWB82_06180 [Caballeronia glebae]